MKRTGSRGFSLLELMIVVGILLVISAVAIPKMFNSIALMRLRSATGRASGVIQDARMLAVKQNTYEKVLFTALPGSSSWVAYIDLDNSNSVQSTEPQAQLGGTIVYAASPTGPPAMDTATLGFTPVTSTTVSFNPRGLPCSAAGTCAVGFAFYFTDGRSAWAAVSVSPAGRIKTWMWTGSAWGN